MPVVIDMPGADGQGRGFLTWAPVEATARFVDGPGNGAAVDVTLRNAGTDGRLAFAPNRTHQGSPTLDLSLPADGTPVKFWVAGAFQQPSTAIDDAVVEAAGSGSAGVLGRKAAMVRIRKDATTLTPAERDRFVAAFGTLNGGGT